MLFLRPFFAHADESREIRSRIQMGSVQAELLVETDDKAGRLMPGDLACYRVTALNQGGRAWLRIRLQGENVDVIPGLWPLTLTGMSEEFVRRGDFLYCLRPLAAGERIQVFTGFQIPVYEELKEKESFVLRAVPEVMQDLGKTPDFGAQDPWSRWDTVAETGKWLLRDGNSHFVITAKQDQLEFKGQMFEGLLGLLPGERVTEELIVQNQTGQRAELRIRLHTELLSAKEQELLEKLSLSIERDGKRFYDAGFLGDALKNGISLGQFGDGTEKLRFLVTAPAELDNSWQKASASPVWSFSVREMGNPSGGSGGGSSGGGGSLNSESPGSGSSGKETDRASAIYTEPDAALRYGLRGGEWRLVDAESHLWQYVKPDGRLAKDGWMFLYNPYAREGQGEDAWFKFDAEGQMEYGWIRSENHNWYYCHAKSDGQLGAMKRGWHLDEEDGKYYYLDPLNGIMQTGWRKIDGKDYYFAGLSDIPEQTWYFEAFGQSLGDTAFGKWVYKRMGVRSYGSLYQKERTPDGSLVGEGGARYEASS